MNDNRTINIELVKKGLEEKGYYYILAEKYYGKEYTGPKYIVAVNDERFTELHPEFTGMTILPADKFILMAQVINQSILNDRREIFRHIKLHNDEGYYEDITDSEPCQNMPLAIKDKEQDTIENEVEFEIYKEHLMAAISKLKEIPRRRLLAYFFEGKTQRDIAKEEGVNRNAVEKSIEGAIRIIKKYL